MAAGGRRGPGFQTLRQLLRWFKDSFFQWVNTPPCQACQGEDGLPACDACGAGPLMRLRGRARGAGPPRKRHGHQGGRQTDGRGAPLRRPPSRGVSLPRVRRHDTVSTLQPPGQAAADAARAVRRVGQLLHSLLPGGGPGREVRAHGLGVLQSEVARSDATCTGPGPALMGARQAGDGLDGPRLDRGLQCPAAAVAALRWWRGASVRMRVCVTITLTTRAPGTGALGRVCVRCRQPASLAWTRLSCTRPDGARS